MPWGKYRKFLCEEAPLLLKNGKKKNVCEETSLEWLLICLLVRTTEQPEKLRTRKSIMGNVQTRNQDKEQER